MSELFERPQYQTTVPEYERYANAFTSPEPELMQQLVRETNLAFTTPGMLSGLIQGRLLQMLIFMLKPEHILEIGTFTGYSAIYMASALSETGILHTIDNNPEVAHIAHKYFRLAGVENRIRMHMANALTAIPVIEGVFDLVFIDADKENYVSYYEAVLPRLRPGGFIIADNVLWYGRVLQAEVLSDKETQGIAAFNLHVKNDPRIEHLLLPVRDGLMIIRKL
ncbi:MAG: O-methyltransferase [Lentimicrobium sp.]|nr:O-methyltransferase [Lentimicrobium sp.]